MRRGALALALLLPLACGDAPPGSQPAATQPATLPSPSRAPAPATARAPQESGWHATARLRRPVLLRERPGGDRIARLGRRTEFGTLRVLAVLERRPGWLGVLATEAGNGRVGWIPASGAVIERQPRSVEVSLSRRELIVRRGGRVESRHRVAIGAPSTSTPTGRFAVTDRLRTDDPTSPYGCCILALTGRQPNLPQGWGGGDRLAIHGTPSPESIGRAASSGCLRASRASMRSLMKRIGIGTRVTIHR